MDLVLSEFKAGLPDLGMLVRLGMAMLLGAIIGFQRERQNKPAGLRTHILVAMGTALFVIGAIDYGMSSDGLSRVIQGLITGLGFIGAGAIIKVTRNSEVHGLTTAAGIWATAAIGVAVGLGLFGLAMLSVILIWIVLAGLGYLEARMEHAADVDRSARSD
jgi:putative Mg2+ transporter-C (MgtC) family protein